MSIFDLRQSYVVRQKIGGVNMNLFHLQQLPVLSPVTYASAEIAEDGIPLPPFKWDENRRAILRAELDAYYAKLYGPTRDELRYNLNPKDGYGRDFPR